VSQVDVLMPFHRDDVFLQKAIRSVLDSRELSFTLYLIDDRAQPKLKLADLVEDPRVRYVSTGGRQGYGAAIGMGISLSESPYVALMNSDDLVHPFRFSRQLSSLKEADVCITKMQKFSSKFRMLPSISGEFATSTYSHAFLYFGSYGADATWMATHSWMKKNWSIDSTAALDWRIALRAFPNTRIQFLPEVLYFYRSHPLQTSKFEISDRDFFLIYQSWRENQSESLKRWSSPSVFQIFAAPWRRDKLATRPKLVPWIEALLEELEGQPHEVTNQVKGLIARRLKLAAIQGFLHSIQDFKSLAKFWPFDSTSLYKDVCKSRLQIGPKICN